jgi:V-type H+-transporting ATPase subunit H
MLFFSFAYYIIWFFRSLQELGAKQQIMQLMTHENNDVRYQALLAVQTLMLQAF